jgi:translation elongation factor EF-Ts
MEGFNMDITLEKVDAVVDRTGVSYKEAKDALEKSDGNVIEAIVYLEQQRKSWGSSVNDKGEEVLDKLKEAIRKGNATKIIIKKDGDIIMNIPVTAGAIGTILSLPMAAIGLSAAMLSKCTFEIVREDGQIVNVNDVVEKKVDKVKDTFKNEN